MEKLSSLDGDDDGVVAGAVFSVHDWCWARGGPITLKNKVPIVET